jgi:hypothetical protein
MNFPQKKLQEYLENHPIDENIYKNGYIGEFEIKTW